MNSYIGQLLDNRYELLEVIGTGGMAVVYKARCHRLNRFVAVKVLKDEFSGDEEFRRRFRAEGEAVAMLSHPNIVQVFDVSATDKANFIVMELIDGISLKQYMEAKGNLNWKETLHFATQIAKGLEHAHSRGIVHRDIKPHNVMVLKNGSVKVMDFGIAQVMNKASTLTKEALGSVHYISPEQAKGSYTDNRSDIYSLGVVMYEMMAGRPPYDGESAVAVAIQHINGGAPLPTAFNPNIPRALEQIIMKCMALDARDRYANAQELLADLEEFRKNPDVVFQYHSLVDDATRTIEVVSSVKPRNTAERVVQARTGNTGSFRRPAGSTGSIRKPTGSTGRVRQTQSIPTSSTPARDPEAARRARLRRQEEERLAAERSRITGIAVVACSAVAIIAIIVFLVAIFNGTVLGQNKELVEVPYLVGKLYTEDLAARYPNLYIRLLPQQYADDFSKGQIMNQAPEGGSMVAKGTELFITVSMGEEPMEKVMENLLGVTLDRAQSFLSGQGFKALIREEANDEYPAGVVVRTEPAADTPLVDGQTVKLWVSTGPDVTLAKMPDVLGMDEATALKVLDQLGFHNVNVYAVDSDKPEGEVINQSQVKQTEIDVTTLIILEISRGPVATTEATAATEETAAEEETAPTAAEDPMEPTAPQKTTESVTFAVPNRTQGYYLTIYREGQPVVSNVFIQPGVSSCVVDLNGSGEVLFDLFIDSEYYVTQKVTFKNNG